MAANEEASASSLLSFLLGNAPYAILSNITKFIDQSDLFVLCQVSQQFNELILTPGVITTMRCHYLHLQSDNFYQQIVAPRGESIRELIVDDLISDGQVRRLLALCPNLLKFEQRILPTLYKYSGQSVTRNGILLALADYCKQVKEVKLVHWWSYDTPELLKFANECQKLTNFSGINGPVLLNNKILPIIAAGNWSRLAKIFCDLDETAIATLSSLPITHLMVRQHEDQAGLKNLLNRLPNLQHFGFGSSHDLDLIVKHLTTACTQLTSVTLINQMNSDTLKILVNGCPLIEFADLKAASIVDESILHTIGQGWKNLKDLKFVAMFTIKTKNILSSCGQCSQLHSVDFTFSTITDAILADNITCLPKHLKHFRLSCKSAGVLTAKAISAHLVNITSATYQMSNLPSAACQPLFNMRRLTQLTVLNAQFINNEGIAKLAQSSCASTLQSLELYDCYNLTGECFSCFTKLRKLRKLIVSGTNYVTNGAIQALTQCDEFCKRLQHLEILGGGVTDAVFKSLAKFSDLRICRLRDFIEITEAGIQDLFNNTKSPYLIDVQFSKHKTGEVQIPNELIEARLNVVRELIDNYYRTGGNK